jgi:hypothetical protein
MEGSKTAAARLVGQGIKLAAVAAVGAIAVVGCGGSDGSDSTGTQVCVVERVGLKAVSCDQENAVPAPEFERFHDCVDQITGKPAPCGAENAIDKDHTSADKPGPSAAKLEAQRRADAKTSGSIRRHNQKLYRALERSQETNPALVADLCLAIESRASIDSPELSALLENYLRRLFAGSTELGYTPDQVIGVISNFCKSH